MFLRLRICLGAGLSCHMWRHICLWSDIVSWLSTCQLCKNGRSDLVLVAIVMSMMEHLLPLQNVYSHPLLTISNLVVARYSLSAFPLWLYSWHPHSGWCALASLAKNKGIPVFYEYRIMLSSSLNGNPISMGMYTDATNTSYVQFS